MECFSFILTKANDIFLLFDLGIESGMERAKYMKFGPENDKAKIYGWTRSMDITACY